MADVPIRLTPRRAFWLLHMVDRGIETERREIEGMFGVKFADDGTVDVNPESFALRSPGDEEILELRLQHLTAALDAATIIRRRYA